MTKINYYFTSGIVEKLTLNFVQNIVHYFLMLSVFTTLHGMQTRCSDENSVRPSVCLSVCLSNTWIVTEQKKIYSDFYTLGKII